MSNRTSSSRPLAVFASIFLAFCFVLMGVWARFLRQSFGDFQQVYLRIFLAGVVALVLFRKQFTKGTFKSLNTKEWVIIIARGVISYGIGVALFTVAVQHTKLSIVSFVSALPILGLLAYVMFREKMPWRNTIVVFVSIIGLAFLTGFDFRDFHLGFGELMAVLGMLGFDIGYLMSRMHTKKLNNYQITTLMLLTGWIAPFLTSVFLKEPLIPPSVTFDAGWALVIATLMNVSGLFLVNYIFAHLKAHVAGNLLLLEGVFAIAIGFLLYKEIPSSWELFGALVIIACALLINHFDTRARTEEALAYKDAQIG